MLNSLGLLTALLASQSIIAPTESTYTNFFNWGDSSSQKTISYDYSGSGYFSQWWTKCQNIWNFPQRDCPFGEGDVVQCYSRTTTYRILSGQKCSYTSSAIQLFRPAVTVTTDCRIVDSCHDGSNIDIYKWKFSDWSECGCDGKQTRTVTCTNKDAWNSPGAIHQPEWCAPSKNPFCGSQPTTQQSCTPPMKKCNQHRWRISEWSQCSAT